MNNNFKTKMASAKDDLNKCTIKSCTHIPKLKEYIDHMEQCYEKTKDLPLMEKINKLNECNTSINPDTMLEIGKCLREKCNDKMTAIADLSKSAFYEKHPKGKRLIKIQNLLKQLKDEGKKCKEQKCSHIYPFDKLKKESDECEKHILSNHKLYSQCMDKYNIYDKNIKINGCVKTYCNDIKSKIDKLNAETFNILNDKKAMNSFKNQVKSGTRKQKHTRKRK